MTNEQQEWVLADLRRAYRQALKLDMTYPVFMGLVKDAMAAEENEFHKEHIQAGRVHGWRKNERNGTG